MKKLTLILVLLLFCAQSVLADEVTPAQIVKNDQSYFTANLQKQPQEGKQKQDITNHFTFFTINVQINGKADCGQRTEGGNGEFSTEDPFNASNQAIKADTAPLPSGE